MLIKVMLAVIIFVFLIATAIVSIHFETSHSEVSNLLSQDPPEEFYIYPRTEGYPNEVIFSENEIITEFHNIIKNKTADRQSEKLVKENIALSMGYGYKGDTIYIDTDGRLFISENASVIRNKSRLHWFYWKIFLNSNHHIIYYVGSDAKLESITKTIINYIQNNKEHDTGKYEIDEIKAFSIIRRFINDMANSWLKLERVDMSEYLVDNLDTHLSLKWIDYDIADRLQNTWRQLKSIDSIELSNGKFKSISEKQVIYEAFADIKYTRYEPSVNGIGINLAIELELIDGKWMITRTDTYGASVYREWRKKQYSNVEEMDAEFLKSCKEHGLSVGINR